jgi:hypothetical protein
VHVHDDEASLAFPLRNRCVRNFLEILAESSHREDRLLAARRGRDFAPEARDHGSEYLSVHAIVVDDEYQRHGGRPAPLFAGRKSAVDNAFRGF